MNDRIHRYWEGGETPVGGQWTVNVIRKLHPGVDLHDWTPGEVADIVVDESQVKAVDVVRHRSNVIRYTLLYRHGGLWLDHDFVPLANLFVARRDAAWTASLNGNREGSVLRFPAGHPFLAAALAEIEKAPRSQRRSAEVSGARLLDRILVPGVTSEDRVVPFDEAGRLVRRASGPPLGVHLWVTSSLRLT